VLREGSDSEHEPDHPALQRGLGDDRRRVRQRLRTRGADLTAAPPPLAAPSARGLVSQH
jgi:hypothetical protein